MGRRNIFYQFDIPGDSTIDTAIAWLTEQGMRVWVGEAGKLTLAEISPVMIQDGEVTWDNMHLWDDFDYVFLRNSQMLENDREKSLALLATVARLEGDRHSEHLPRCCITLTFTGNVPNPNKNLGYTELTQRLFDQII